MTGETLSHYRLLEKLGEGGMGVVYRAEDTRLRRSVALKFLQPELTRDTEARERFLREARAAAALDHPHICTVHEIDEAEGRVFIAMAFVEGRTLKQRLAEGPLPLDEIVSIVTQVAEGLKAAHERGIVHRDIKPANLMLTAAGQVRIMDFGLAKLERATELTSRGTIMGTVTYMSPEQARGERVDHRTDLWSLGCVMYEMIAGRQPFPGDYGLAVLHAILHDEPTPVTSTRERVPAHLASIVHRCLQKEPGRRHATADDLLTDLRTSPPRAEAGPSIAVLPFVDMSPGKDQEYFCDGIAEELINGLTHVKNLRVVARTSAFAFKGQNLDVREIGRRLNVRAVLEGSIRKAGDRLRITAQLINVEDGYHVWSERFDRPLADIFEIQDEVAAAVVEVLRVRLLTHEKAAIERRHTSDPETYTLYLKGRHDFARPTIENLERAAGYYQQAIEREPGFAPAWVGIAGVYVAFASLALSSPADAWAKAKVTIRKALAIDEDLAEAHALAAAEAMYFDWGWDAAEKSYRRAFALSPGNGMAHAQFAWFCVFMGRFDEAVAEIGRAQDVDPLMPLFRAFSVGIHRYAGRLDEAIAEFHKTIELDPRSGLAYFHVGTAYFAKGMLDEAREAFERSLDLVVFSGWAEGFLGFVHVAQGRRDAAERLLQSMLEKRQRMYVSAACIALLLWQLGRADEAFDYFDKALDEHDTIMPLANIPIFPFSSDLQREPRFRAILGRMHFPTIA